MVDFVRCPESESIRFSEVAYVLQLWYFQSVTRHVSVVAWVSASRRVRYGRFHCIHFYAIPQYYYTSKFFTCNIGTIHDIGSFKFLMTVNPWP